MRFYLIGPTEFAQTTTSSAAVYYSHEKRGRRTVNIQIGDAMPFQLAESAIQWRYFVAMFVCRDADDSKSRDER